MKLKHACELLAITGMLAMATPALAEVITLDASSVGNSYTFDYDGFSDGTTVDGLTAQTTFTLTGISGNEYSFNYSLTNTTSAPLTSRVSSFGFNTNPDITDASSTGAFSYAQVGSSYPNGIGSIDVCFKDASTGACSGGGSGGLATGESGSGSFLLTFANPVTSLDMGDFYVRYQSITGASGITSASGIGTQTSTGGTTTSSGGTEVPEPGMIGILGGGLLALGLLRRRRKVSLQPA